MGKRDNDKFERKGRDFYATIDPAAVKALIDHLPIKCQFVEPCAGAGDLITELCKHYGVSCLGAWDIEPKHKMVIAYNCLDTRVALPQQDCFITNPPFTWDMLKPILDHLPTIKPTWLLLPADYMHNVRVGPYMKKCVKIVSIGRLYWEPNKKKGVDNYCWYLFDANYDGETTFYGR